MNQTLKSASAFPGDEESEKASAPEGKKEYAKAQIETITEELESISEKAPYDLGNTKNYFIVRSGKNAFRLEKKLQKSIHMAPGGRIEIYSSIVANHQK